MAQQCCLMTHSFREFTPSVQQLKLSLQDVFEALHYQPLAADDPISEAVREAYDRLSEWTDIRGGYVVFDNVELLPSEGRIVCGGGTACNDGSACSGTIEIGRKVCGYLRGSTSAALFLCTAGEGFTVAARQYTAEGDYLKAYIVDLLGSLTAERATDYLQQQLQVEAETAGMRITNRYSPGYCHWNLSEQASLFALLPKGACRITLSPSMLMNPIKSTSGIIGIGADVAHHPYVCNICGDAKCIYRKIIKG